MAGYAEVLSAYSQRAPELRTRWADLDITDWLRPVAPHLKGRQVLDVGAGTGRLAQDLAHRARVTAVEPVAELWSVPLPRLDDRLPRLRKVRGRFDIVLCLGVLHHLTPRDQQAALRRLAQLTRPGGTIILAARHGTTSPLSWPVRAQHLSGHGLARCSLTRRPAIQPASRNQGVRFSWLVLGKTRAS